MRRPARARSRAAESAVFSVLRYLSRECSDVLLIYSWHAKTDQIVYL